MKIGQTYEDLKKSPDAAAGASELIGSSALRVGGHAEPMAHERAEAANFITRNNITDPQQDHRMLRHGSINDPHMTPEGRHAMHHAAHAVAHQNAADDARAAGDGAGAIAHEGLARQHLEGARRAMGKQATLGAAHAFSHAMHGSLSHDAFAHVLPADLTDKPMSYNPSPLEGKFR